jgi:asparagine synthase (glutamine-hydrolysing)
MKINENEPGDKQSQFFQKTNDGKQILRDMMGRYIPETITKAAKQGFSSPDASWFKGESIDFVKRTLLNGNSHIYNVLDHKAVVPLVEQHLRGEENRRLLIWSLLNVEAWMKDSL